MLAVRDSLNYVRTRYAVCPELADAVRGTLVLFSLYVRCMFITVSWCFREIFVVFSLHVRTILWYLHFRRMFVILFGAIVLAFSLYFLSISVVFCCGTRRRIWSDTRCAVGDVPGHAISRHAVPWKTPHSACHSIIAKKDWL